MPLTTVMKNLAFVIHHYCSQTIRQAFGHAKDLSASEKRLIHFYFTQFKKNVFYSLKFQNFRKYFQSSYFLKC